MKVYPCSKEFAEKKEPETLTWEEIKEEEGVYVRKGEDHYKLIVLKFGNSTSVLFSHGDTLEPACGVAWSYLDFVKLENAKVCFEIKES